MGCVCQSWTKKLLTHLLICYQCDRKQLSRVWLMLRWSWPRAVDHKMVPRPRIFSDSCFVFHRSAAFYALDEVTETWLLRTTMTAMLVITGVCQLTFDDDDDDSDARYYRCVNPLRTTTMTAMLVITGVSTYLWRRRWPWCLLLQVC